MGVMLELLIPGMKNAEEADLGAEMTRVFSDFLKRLGAATEQQAVNDLFVLQGQWRQFVRECENDMGVARRQKFGAPCVQPAVAGIALAPRAMPIPARIERDGLMAAAQTLVDMATQRGGAAAKDGREHFQVQPGEPGGMPVDESVGCGAYDIGQFKERPIHLTVSRLMLCAVLRRCQRECVERARDCPEPRLGQMQVAAGGFQIRVPEQQLNGPQIRTGVEQMRCETVAQSVRVHSFPDSGAGGSVFDGEEDALAAQGHVAGVGGSATGEQVSLRPGVRRTPVSAKFLEQPRAEHDVAILFAFTLLDVNQHACAVDVFDFELNQFFAPHAGGVQG
jgi:hypothetical protein